MLYIKGKYIYIYFPLIWLYWVFIPVLGFTYSPPSPSMWDLTSPNRD